MISTPRYRVGDWQPRRAPLLVMQTEAEAAAERVEDALSVMATVTSLMTHIVGNLSMLGRCKTEQARTNAICTIRDKADAMGRLMVRMHGELDSAPFHLNALRVQDLSYRILEVALQKVGGHPVDQDLWRDELDLIAFRMQGELMDGSIAVRLSQDGAA